MLELLSQHSIIATLILLAALSLPIIALPRQSRVPAGTTIPLLAERVDQLLPQTQCGQCGYPGCRPYARAIAEGDAINKCPPGGQRTIDALADLLNVHPLPLDAEHGEESTVKKVAFIREAECIGCTKCIQACPVDAILGAAKQMHTVIIDECTGCDLCVDPCPVDCIEMVPVSPVLAAWTWDFPAATMIASDKSAPRTTTFISADKDDKAA